MRTTNTCSPSAIQHITTVLNLIGGCLLTPPLHLEEGESRCAPWLFENYKGSRKVKRLPVTGFPNITFFIAAEKTQCTGRRSNFDSSWKRSKMIVSLMHLVPLTALTGVVPPTSFDNGGYNTGTWTWNEHPADWIYADGPTGNRHEVYYNQWSGLDDSQHEWTYGAPCRINEVDGWLNDIGKGIY